MVLVLIAFLTATAGLMLDTELARSRLVRREALRVQARYTAEAGLSRALVRLRDEPGWRPEAEVLHLFDGGDSRIIVAPFGAWTWVRSTATTTGASCTVQALIGEHPALSLEPALVLADSTATLHVAGTTAIRGDVRAGRGRLQRRSLDGRPFIGLIDGRVTPARSAAALVAPAQLISTLAEAEALLNSSTSKTGSHGVATTHLPGEQALLARAADLRLDAADVERRRHGVTLVARGDLLLDGPLTLPAGSRLLAGGRVTLRGVIRGEALLLYGREGVAIDAGTEASGQFLTAGQIEVGAGARLVHPSVLFSTAALAGEAIVVRGGARVDGVVLLAPDRVTDRSVPPRVLIEKDAAVRGLVVSLADVEMRGVVLGTLQAQRLTRYIAPARYENWLVDAVVDRSERPDPFAVPVGSAPGSDLAVVHWEATCPLIPPTPP